MEMETDIGLEISESSCLENPDDPEYIPRECEEGIRNSIISSCPVDRTKTACEIDEQCEGVSECKSKSQDDMTQSNVKTSKGFPCVICGHVASSTGRLKEHHSKHTGKKPLQCNICKKKFAWRNSYRSHMACHDSNNPNRCHICEKKYCNKASLKKHVLRVHQSNERQLKTCDKCDKTFHTDSDLQRHSFAHTSERPCVCERCGKSYRYKTALAVHMRTHGGDKPYKCQFCDASFFYLSSAIGHRRIHTREKPFQCSVCHKRCRTKRLLSSHMSVHTTSKQFRCTSCGKAYSSRSGYRSHMDYHLGLKRHVCKYCGKAFRARNNMDKHVRRHAKNGSCLQERTKLTKRNRPKISSQSNPTKCSSKEKPQPRGPKNVMPMADSSLLSRSSDSMAQHVNGFSTSCQFEPYRNLPLPTYDNRMSSFLPKLNNLEIIRQHEFVDRLPCKPFSVEEMGNGQAVHCSLNYNSVVLDRSLYSSNPPTYISQSMDVRQHLVSSQCPVSHLPLYGSFC